MCFHGVEREKCTLFTLSAIHACVFKPVSSLIVLTLNPGKHSYNVLESKPDNWKKLAIISGRNRFVPLSFASDQYARCLTPTHLSVHTSCFIYPAHIGKKSQLYVHKRNSATIGFTSGTRAKLTAVILGKIDVVSTFKDKCRYGGDLVCWLIGPMKRNTNCHR